MKKHIPVLANKLVELIQPKKGENFADVTAGFGGHSKIILELVGQNAKAFLFDRDLDAVSDLREEFAKYNNVTVQHKKISEIDWQNDMTDISIVIADLGVSSHQFDEAKRGFSILRPGPLDMRMDQSQDFSAYDVVNGYSKKDLAEIIFKYSQEPKSRQIAASIVEHRNKKVISTTQELADIVSSVVKPNYKIHPATKTFQAIRIEVNQEISELESLLQEAPKFLKPKGRLAIISFHSIEDRMVKQAFKQLASPTKDTNGNVINKPKFKLVTKKPIKGSEFDKSNLRARSAKLRVLEKIN